MENEREIGVRMLILLRGHGDISPHLEKGEKWFWFQTVEFGISQEGMSARLGVGTIIRIVI